jgi:hypothetical protein
MDLLDCKPQVRLNEEQKFTGSALSKTKDLNHPHCVIFFCSTSRKVLVNIIPESVFENAVERSLFHGERDVLCVLIILVMTNGTRPVANLPVPSRSVEAQRSASRTSYPS